jgi:hypothetical protein
MARSETTIDGEARARDLASRRTRALITCELPGCGKTREVYYRTGSTKPRTCGLAHRVALHRLEARQRLERERGDREITSAPA